MNLAEKREVVERGIESIATHSDVDAAVRKAALQQVIDRCGDAMASVDAEVNEQILALGS